MAISFQPDSHFSRGYSLQKKISRKVTRQATFFQFFEAWVVKVPQVV